ncbi:MAG: methyltransferase [Anaerolineae bacterium]|nr:methyltransferase [Anaerolineae bacterium]
MEPYLLSYIQAAPLLAARNAGASQATTSLDLGLSTVEVALDPAGILLPDRQRLSWGDVEEVAADESVCYLVQDNTVAKIHRFSKQRNLLYVLMPTERAPTVLISGIQMHRVKDIDPWGDTLEKIRTIKPVEGRVLDTTTGLGYTAIAAAAEGPQAVVTIEIDSNMIDMARINPWSRPLFDHPRITRMVGDAFEVVQDLEAGSFSRIVHDPPMFARAGDLYSGEFYGYLYRLLSRGGRLYHYVGDPDSRSGRNITRGVVRRLQESGFRRVSVRPRAFGVVATK